jgi:hypothetical protein
LIGAIGKCLGGDAKAHRPTRRKQRGTGQAEEDQRRIEGQDRARDRLGKPFVCRGHVVKGAVWLDVLKTHAFALRHSGNGRNLVQDQIFRFWGREAHLASSETGEVLETRVRPDGDAVGVR